MRSSSGKVRQEKDWPTARREGDRAKHTFWCIIGSVFRLEQTGSKPRAQILRAGLLAETSWRLQSSIVGCDLTVQSGASAKDQCACESKSRGQSDCTQEPPLAAAQARAWESTTKYSNAPLLDLLHSSPQHSTYINSPEATTNHSSKIGIIW